MTKSNLSADRIALMTTFIQIIEAKSLSEAARQLKTTQPTISRRLKLLETNLGTKLIQRTTHRMHPTDEGAAFYLRAKEIVERWDAIENEIKGTREKASGTLRVHVPHVLGQEQLLTVLDRYLKQNEDVKVEWYLKDRLPDFVAENIDCAIHVGYIEEPSLVATKLFDIHRVIVASPKLVKSSKGYEHPESLAKVPWLSFQKYYSDQVEFVHKKNKQGFTLNIEPVFSTDSFYALRKMTLSGHGISILSKWAIGEDLKRGDLIELCSNWEAQIFSVYLTYPQSRHRPAKLTRFIELVKNEKILPS